SRLALRQLAFDRVVVVFAVLDRVIKDRRVGGQPGDRQLVDVAPEHGRPQQVARDVVKPKALAEIVKCSSCVHSALPPGCTGYQYQRRMLERCGRGSFALSSMFDPPGARLIKCG